MKFATKPQLGIAMLARAHVAGVLQGWVSADEAYGQNPEVVVDTPVDDIADRIHGKQPGLRVQSSRATWATHPVCLRHQVGRPGG